MRYPAAVAVLACVVKFVASTSWFPGFHVQKRNDDSPASRGFVTSNNGKLYLNGSVFRFVAVDVHWLQHLSDTDVNATLANIAHHNVTVVRTWGFNDVTQVPKDGAWFQTFNPNGTATINMGPSGLKRLDQIIASAEVYKLKVLVVLTNNWNPEVNATESPRPRGYLSNDYGGMDAYVRANNLSRHDQFFTNKTLIDAFKNYVDVVISRYRNMSTVLAWEIANDPRCNSTLPNAPTCNTQTVTRWHDEIGKHIKRVDHNHIVASGTGGFLCQSCPKLFSASAPPTVSPVPGQRRRATSPLALNVVPKQRSHSKRNAEATKQRREGAASEQLVKWAYKTGHSKRQAMAVSSAYDGSSGVDSQDILNSPNVDLGTFQIFPDQERYGSVDPTLSYLDQVMQMGTDWITQQAQIAQSSEKPVIITSFGLVTKDNINDFVPFNSTQSTISTIGTHTTSQMSNPVVGVEQGQQPVNTQQQQEIFKTWMSTAFGAGVSGVTAHQWGQENLTEPLPQSQIPLASKDSDTFVPSLGQQNMSPNDGYRIDTAAQAVLQQAASQLNTTKA